MPNAITSIDHPVIAVADMAAARTVFERLGFVVPPRGSHVEWGTGNWCVMFPRDYLELRGIIDPTRFTLDLPEFLERRGECLMGVAFGTVGAQESYDRMVANGLQPKEVRSLTRNFELPEGWVQPRFELCFPSQADAPGLMHVVVCEHLTPELTRRPEFLEHPNTATAVLSMSGVIDDFDAVERAQKRFLGPSAVRRDADAIVLEVPSGQTIRLASAEAYRRTWGALAPDPLPEPPFLGAIRLAVADIGRVAQVLETNGIEFETAADGASRVGPDDACGVLLEFAAVD